MHVVLNELGGKAGELGCIISASKDLVGMMNIVQLVRTHKELKQQLSDTQLRNNPLGLIADNITRWEGI